MNGNFIQEQSHKSNQERGMFTNEIAGSINDICAEYPASELTVYKNKDKIHVRSTVHYQRSLRIPWSEITQVEGFDGDSNSGRVFITHIPDIGVPQSWVYSCFNDGGYAYFDDLPFSEIIIGGALGYCEFTYENVTGNHNIIVNGCVFSGIQANITNWHEIRNTEYGLVYNAIPNDFNINITNNFSAPGDYTNITIAVSEGEYVTDSSGNVLDIVENVSTETGNVSLFDVSGLNNTDINIIDDYLNTAGDCHVFDVVGETRTLVTDPDYVLPEGNHWEIENGVVRIVFDKSVDVYVYVDGGWVSTSIRTESISMYPYIDTTSGCFNVISPDEISITFNGSSNDVAISYVLQRGKNHVVISLSNGVYRTTFYPNLRFYYDSIGNFYDTAFAIGSEDLYNMMWGVSFSPGCDYISFGVVDSLDMQNRPSVNLVHHLSSGYGESLWLGALPISPTYIEAEAMTLGGGATLSTDANMYPGTGNTGVTLDAQDEYAEKTYVVGTDIDVAEHKLFVRANDSAQVADDFEISVYDVTGEADILAATTKTLAAAFDTHSVDFTLTPAMDEHTIRIRLKKATATTNTISADYLLIVNTGAIQQAAERSLLNITTTENSFEYVSQNFTVSAGTVENETSIAFSSTETMSLDTNESITNISIVTESEDYGYNVSTWFTENTTLIDEKLTDSYYQLSIRHIPGNDFSASVISYTSDSNPILASAYLDYNFTSTNDNASLAYNDVTREWTITGGPLTSGDSDVYNIMAFYDYETVLDVYGGFGDEHVETYPITGDETNAIGSKYVVSSDSELLEVMNGADLWVSVTGVIAAIIVVIFSGFIIRKMRDDF